MIITRFNNGLIKFSPEGKAEAKSLRKFPGLLSFGLEKYCVSKPHVVTNLVERLQARGFKPKLDADTHALVHGTFKLRPIPEGFVFLTDPLEHQVLALRFLLTVGCAGLLLEAGMGKTKIILDYIALQCFNKTLIIAPKALLFVWEDEVAKHRHDKTVYVVKTTDWESEKEGILKADIVVVNYSKAVLLESQLCSIPWDYLNVDEFLIKDPTSLRTNSITKIGEQIKYKTGASGTLVNNTPLDVFAPVRFLEPSLTGTSYANFRDEYSVVKEAIKQNGDSYRAIVGFRKQPEVKSILHSCSIVMTKEQWLKNLPSKKFVDVQTYITDEQREHYHNIAGNYITKIGDRYVEVDNPLTVLCKLLQIANGFLYITDNSEELEWMGVSEKKPKKAKREIHFFEHQPKAERLIELLSNELVNRRAIIWYNLYAERLIIEKHLAAKGIPYLVIAGGEKDTGGKVKEFNSSNKYHVLLCQAKSVNYGVTVLGSKPELLEGEDVEAIPDVDTEVYTQVFYSLSFSLEVYLQQQDRTHRIGQTRECEYYHILSNSPIERDLVKKLKDKLLLREDFLTDIAKQYGDTLLAGPS